MIVDNQSPPGSWRKEILRGPATTSQLREIIAELEQALRDEKTKNAKLKKEISDLWTALKST
jgi:cell division protein FtsL